MDAQTDAQLLRAYAERRSDAAFAELVRRHIDLVHSAARRMVCDAHLAEDVTQATFVALAKSAPQFTDRPVLAGWLHRTAQNIAAQTVRTDVRRRAREQEAAAMNELLSDSGAGVPPAWSEIAPHLDAALGELNEPERDAVLLRYFERQSARDMAQTLGISDEAAQKRVSRAVDRLREFFAKRGVTVGAGGLAVVISANAVQAAPVSLALTISTAATLAGTTLATTATVAATKAVTMTALQKTVITAIIAVLAGAGIYEARQAAQLHEQVQTLEERQAPLVLRTEQLSQELIDASNRVAGFQAEIARLNRNTAELLRLRGEIAQLRLLGARQETNVTTTTIDDQASLERENQIRDLIKKANSQYVVEGRLLVLKNRLQLSAEQVSLVRQILERNADDFSYTDSKKLDPNIAAILTPDQKAVAEQAAEAEWTSSRLELAKMCAESDYRRLRFFLGVDESQKARVLPILEAYRIGMQQLEDAKRGAASAGSFWSVEEELSRQKINGLKGILSPEQYEIFRGNEEALIEAGRLNHLDR